MSESPPEPKRAGFFARLKQGLGRSAEKLGGGIKTLLVGRKLDAEAWDAIEESLIMADMGPRAASSIGNSRPGSRRTSGTGYRLRWLSGSNTRMESTSSPNRSTR